MLGGGPKIVLDRLLQQPAHPIVGRRLAAVQIELFLSPGGLIGGGRDRPVVLPAHHPRAHTTGRATQSAAMPGRSKCHPAPPAEITGIVHDVGAAKQEAAVMSAALPTRRSAAALLPAPARASAHCAFQAVKLRSTSSALQAVPHAPVTASKVVNSSCHFQRMMHSPCRTYSRASANQIFFSPSLMRAFFQDLPSTVNSP